MSTADLTFLTNEIKSRSLLERFKTLCKDTRFLDCLVGYFYASGFFKLYPYLENVEKIRVLVGMGADEMITEIVTKVSTSNDPENDPELLSPNSKLMNAYESAIKAEMEDCEDSAQVEEGVRKLVEWTQTGKIKIRAFPEKLHAKVYIFTFKKGDRDVGRVITGSSNLTKAGLQDNLEFNVELKNRSDYEFAKKRFEELWEKSVDLSDVLVKTVTQQTWLKDDITPYELFLKFLYEHFKTELSQTPDTFLTEYPANFKWLKYQEHAVLNAKKIVEEHGGVFLSDVVGLGKTYIAAMLVKQLGGKTLIIAPPHLLDRNNPGSWTNVFFDFGIQFRTFSVGKLEDALEETRNRKYANVIIDEAHRFRNEFTKSHELLSQICKNKRVILVTATPYNNSPMDIFNQIKLFQVPRRSTIPGLPNLEGYFKEMEKQLEEVEENDYAAYVKRAKEVGENIRNRVLRHIMVRRTRAEVARYFPEDIVKAGLKFPEIADPIPLYYQLSPEEENLFYNTALTLTHNLKYSRYLLHKYMKHPRSRRDPVYEKNLCAFIKVLLIKRMESSFFAFKRTLSRMAHNYQFCLETLKQRGIFYTSEDLARIERLLEEGEEELLENLIKKEKVKKIPAKSLTPEFEKDLEHDLLLLNELLKEWEMIARDPKLNKLLDELKSRSELRENKIVIFTESKETAEYLKEHIEERLGERVLLYTSSATQKQKREVIANFDANAQIKKNDYRILVTTDALSEGTNLHRANVVINYDIPWNPTRLMQRVGRVNRIGTPHSKIFIFNFFPTAQAEDEIQLEKIARMKIETFFNMLGGDAAVLTEGDPVSSHELFDKLISKKTIEGEEEEYSELKYLKIIRKVQEENEHLFHKIKNLPKKARSCRNSSTEELITYFRVGKLEKFYRVNSNGEPEEIDFLAAAQLFECSPHTPRSHLPISRYFELLNRNKERFLSEVEALRQKGTEWKLSRNEKKLSGIIKYIFDSSASLTEIQEEFLKSVLAALHEGTIHKNIIKKCLTELQKLSNPPPQTIYEIIKKHVPSDVIFEESYRPFNPFSGKKEVILSLYLINDYE